MARGDVVLAEVVEVTTRSHGVVVPGLVRAALEQSGIDWPDLQGIAVSIGPGSFTGLRIGLALAKGIAYAGKLPLVAVPTLEALAWAAEPVVGDLVWAMLDARMREVYVAAFERTTHGLERRTPDEAVAPEALAARIVGPAVLIGDAPRAYPVLGREGVRVLPFESHHPRGGIVARLGAARLAAGEQASLGPLEPVYVRPSQAELARRR